MARRMSMLETSLSLLRSKAAAARGIASPTMLILEPTLQCNSRCRTCFNLEQLNTPGAVLTLEEVEAIAADLPDLVSLLLSGGEPTLYPALAGVARAFARRTKAQYLYIPTNGVIPARVEAEISSVCGAFPGSVVVGLSIDGVGEQHDRIRRVPRNFELLGESYARLSRLKASRPNLHLSATTCVCADNRDDYREILRWVERNWPEVEGHSISLVRSAPGPDVMLDAEEFLAREGASLARDAAGRKAFRLGPVGWLNGLFWTGYYDEALRHSRGERRRWTCSALSGSLYINAKKEVFACEMLRPIAKLGPGASLAAVLASRAAEEERGRIRRKECSCDHACFLQHSAFTEPANAGLWARAALARLR